MMTRLTGSLACVFAFVTTATAAAQSHESDIGDVVRKGMTVSIVDNQGRLAAGRVVDVSDRAIRMTLGQEQRDVPFDEIVRIERTDGLADGARRGFVTGAVIGVLAATAITESRRTGQSRVPTFVGVSFANGLLYASIGTALDAMVDHRQTLYQRGGAPGLRVAPLVDRHTAGAVVTVRW